MSNIPLTQNFQDRLLEKIRHAFAEPVPATPVQSPVGLAVRFAEVTP